MARLEKWHGARPTVEAERDGFVIGAVFLRLGTWRGLWDPKGKLVIGEDRTDLLGFVPDRDEVARVCTTVVGKKWSWRFERRSLDGTTLTSLDTKQYLAGAEPFSMEFPKKYKGEVAKIRVADQSAPWSFYVRDRVAPVGVFDKPAQLAGKPLPPEKRVFRPETTPEELAQLARSSERLAAMAARNVRAPAALIEELSRHRSAAVRVEAAKSDRLSDAALRRLARDKDPNVRLQILYRGDQYDLKAKKWIERAAPRDVVEALTKDPDANVRRVAFGQLPIDATDLAAQPLQARLAAVRWGIPIALERKLAQDPAAEVRLKLAVTRHPRKCGRSPSIDAAALALLKADKSARVREAAAALAPYPKGTKEPPP